MTATSPHRQAVRTRADRKEIPLPDGEVLVPRRQFANNELQMSEKHLRSYNLPTVYLSCVAYIKRNESLQIIADHAKRQNQEPRRRAATKRKSNKTIEASA